MEVGMVSERWARGLARSILLLLERRQGHPGVRITVGMVSERGEREACPRFCCCEGDGRVTPGSASAMCSGVRTSWAIA